MSGSVKSSSILQYYNTLSKRNPPPFTTTLVTSAEDQKLIFKDWSSLCKKNKLPFLSSTLRCEVELLSKFIGRKGTQLRLEKALMLSNRIEKLGRRWVNNKFLGEFGQFSDGVTASFQQKGVKKGGGGVRLPSRQWGNWVIYVGLRDSLILGKIKNECEGTVRYWLGLISSSHHATDSLVAVGILCRIWYISSCMVESLIKVMHPTVYKLSIHLAPTKAENWLEDLEIPSPEGITSWMEEILGEPFVPARLSKGLISQRSGAQFLQQFSESATTTTTTSESIPGQETKTEPSSGNAENPAVASTSNVFQLEGSDEEDLGEVVQFPSKSKQQSELKKLNVVLDERWSLFFKGYKSKLKTEQGKKQFCVRIRKYLREEQDKKVIVKLKRLRSSIVSKEYSEIIVAINQLRKLLSKG